jgi:hypothetical protein
LTDYFHFLDVHNLSTEYARFSAYREYLSTDKFTANPQVTGRDARNTRTGSAARNRRLMILFGPLSGERRWRGRTARH